MLVAFDPQDESTVQKRLSLLFLLIDFPFQSPNSNLHKVSGQRYQEVLEVESPRELLVDTKLAEVDGSEARRISHSACNAQFVANVMSVDVLEPIRLLGNVGVGQHFARTGMTIILHRMEVAARILDRKSVV